MNWKNINQILGLYTQYKHLQILFDKYKLPKKSSKRLMYQVLLDAFSTIPQEDFYDWLTLHQIDGNNYTFVYNLQERPAEALLQNLFDNREKLINLKLWDINPDHESEDLDTVMPNLDGINLVNIHKQDLRYIFAFVAPCVVTGKRDDGSQRFFKKLFFVHCVVSSESDDCKIIFNPTANLLHVAGVQKKRNDWTPIASVFFSHLKKYIGDIKINAPLWIPEALARFVDDATSHNNPIINELSFKYQDEIFQFASKLLKQANVDPDKEQAVLMRFVQDIQLSFEAQLIENYGIIQEEDGEFEIFRQRSDGVTHTIDVESREESLRIGTAAQAARRSRTDGSIDLLGINIKRGDRNYKFLVEQGTEAYLVRGTNTFIEEEVVNIVIRKLNQYRDEIQNTVWSIKQSGEGVTVSTSE